MHAVFDEEICDGHGFVERSTGSVAQVDDDLLRALLEQILKRVLDFGQLRHQQDC